MENVFNAAPLLLLSPHPDDAVFSASSLLERPLTTVWTVFAGVPEEGVVTPWDRANGFTDGASQMRERVMEDQRGLAGVDAKQLDFLERAYTDVARRAADMAQLAAELDAWLDEHADGLVVVPVGSGVRIPTAWHENARARVGTLAHQARHLAQNLRRTPMAADPVGEPGSVETVSAYQAPAPDVGTTPSATSEPRRRFPANLKRAAVRPIQDVLHRDAQRRRRLAQREGMLANEDHTALRDAVVAVAQRRGVDVVLYEEYPYAWSRRGIEQVRSVAARLGRAAQLIEVEANRSAKFTRIQAYSSQLGAMDPEHHRLEDSATIPTTERFWLLSSSPGAVEATPASDKPVDISVVIPTFNGNGVLPLQLEALAHQQDAPAFEVLVVDNGSSQNVSDTVEPFADRLRLRLLDASAHRGPSFARNVGATAAASDKIAFCDDDDCVSPGWVRAAADALDEAPFVTGVGIEYPAALFIDRATIQGRLAADMAGESTALRPTPVLGDYPILLGGTCAIHRQTFVAMGGFDLRFAPGAEDKEFARRYFETGMPLMTAPGMGLAVRLRPSASGSLKRTFRYAHRYVLLCEVHGLMETSPLLNQPDFRTDLLRAAAALALSPLYPGTPRAEILDRLALRAGQLAGWVQHHLFKRVPPQRLGVGLGSVGNL